MKTVFKTKYDGKEVELAVILPSAKIKNAGRLVHAGAYNKAVQAGAILREELEGILRKSKLWDDERQSEYEVLRSKLLEGERKLARKNMKLKEARELAISMSKARSDLQDLLSQRNRVDQNTADAIADTEQFNFLVANCTFYNDTDKPFFTSDGEHASTEVYVERGTDQASIDAATKLSELMFGNEKDILNKLPENQFLKQFNFIDEELHLIDDKKRRIDEKGRLVDADGRFIDEKGNFVDIDGNKVDKDGRYVEESEGFFLDDDGKPIGGQKATEPKPVEQPQKSAPKKEPELVPAQA